MELLTFYAVGNRLYLNGMPLRGVKHYEIKKNSDDPKGASELSLVIAVDCYNKDSEETEPVKLETKTCSGFRILSDEESGTITIVPEVEGAALQLDKDRADKLAARIRTIAHFEDIEVHDSDKDQKEFQATLRHYGISGEEINTSAEFRCFSTKVTLLKLAYGICGLEDACGLKRFRAIIDYDAEWPTYVIRFY